MPLKKGSSRKICHEHGNSNYFFSPCRFPPMFKRMTIGANCFEVFNLVVFSIFIFVVDLKHKLIFNLASFATNFVKFFVCLCKTSNNIIFFAKSSFMNGRAFFRTISAKPIVHFIAARNHCPTPYAGVALRTFNRAIFSFAAKLVCPKFYIASFACSGFIFRLVRTCSRAILLFYTTLAVVQLKCCIANKAVAHGEQYATS